MTLLPDASDERIFRWNQRPWTNKAHLPRNDVEQLRELVEIGPAKAAPEARQARMVSQFLERSFRVGWTAPADPHRPKLQNAKRPTVAPDPVLHEQHRTRIVDDYRKSDGHQ